MSVKKKTHMAILGLLSWQPMSGYDIKKLIEMGLSHFWNESYGNIYPTLDLLVRDGLASKTSSPQTGKRKRNVYRITERGEQLFRDWLQSSTEPPVVRNELQLKFFLSSKCPTKTSLRIVREYEAQQRAALEEFRYSEAILRQAIQTGEFPRDVDEVLSCQETKLNLKQKRRQCKIFLLSLRHGILAMEARIDWCQEVIQVLSE